MLDAVAPVEAFGAEEGVYGFGRGFLTGGEERAHWGFQRGRGLRWMQGAERLGRCAVCVARACGGASIGGGTIRGVAGRAYPPKLLTKAISANCSTNATALAGHQDARGPQPCAAVMTSTSDSPFCDGGRPPLP